MKIGSVVEFSEVGIARYKVRFFAPDGKVYLSEWNWKPIEEEVFEEWQYA
jgi:hypothetical protein